jgi:hypothetical protein
MTLKMLEAAAKKSLTEMAQPGFPSAKIDLVRDLKLIWEQGTGALAGASSTETFDNPRSHFGKFVKLCVQMIPDHKEF